MSMAGSRTIALSFLPLLVTKLWSVLHHAKVRQLHPPSCTSSCSPPSPGGVNVSPCAPRQEFPLEAKGVKRKAEPKPDPIRVCPSTAQRPSHAVAADVQMDETTLLKLSRGKKC